MLDFTKAQDWMFNFIASHQNLANAVSHTSIYHRIKWTIEVKELLTRNSIKYSVASLYAYMKPTCSWLVGTTSEKPVRNDLEAWEGFSDATKLWFLEQQFVPEINTLKLKDFKAAAKKNGSEQIEFLKSLMYPGTIAPLN